MRDIPRYREIDADGNEITTGDHDHEDSEEKSLPVEFSDKTNQLLDYIEKTYLKGMVKNDREGKNIMDKMRLAENSQKVIYLMRLNEKIYIDFFSGKGNGIWI